MATASSLQTFVLKTPLEIYHAASQNFPNLKGKILDTNATVRMELKLSDNVPAVVFETAVDAREFSQELEQLFRRVQIDKLNRNRDAHVYTMDMNRFGVASPLSNWQKFRRVMYEKNGHSCLDAIIAYLQNSDRDETVSFLGFHPNQVESNLTEEDFDYFKEMTTKIFTLQSPQKQTLSVRFREKYPNVFKRVLDFLTKRKCLEQAQNAPDVYHNILGRLRNSVFGQDQATERLATLLTSQKNQKGNGVFLFVGPTGVGKTELAKTVALIKEGRFVFFAMNQYQTDFDITRFFGSPSGYVGSTDKPHFAKEIDNCKPIKTGSEGSTEIYEVTDTVILFDEFEKAHSKVKQSLLTLFDEGSCTIQYSSSGGYSNLSIRYVFKRSVIINTSNLYQQEILTCFRRNMAGDEIARTFVQLNALQPLPSSYSPELLGRMKIIPFGPIPRGNCYQSLIKTKMTAFLEVLRREIACREIFIDNEPQILSILERKLYGEGTDIRRVNRFFSDDVRGAVYRIKGKLGDLSDKKLTFFPFEDKLFFKISIYIEQFEVYNDISEPILLS